MRKTAHGHKMSPRMERLWAFIQDERRIHLNDWSTDECVYREQKRLKEGEAVLLERFAANPSKDLEHLLLDYRTIMNRLPHERTTAAMQKSEAKALAARGQQPEKAQDSIAEMIGEKAR